LVAKELLKKQKNTNKPKPQVQNQNKPKPKPQPQKQNKAQNQNQPTKQLNRKPGKNQKGFSPLSVVNYVERTQLMVGAGLFAAIVLVYSVVIGGF